MLGKDQIIEKLNTYRENVSRSYKLDEGLFEMADFSAWQEALYTRSESLRGYFISNVRILDELREVLAQPLTAETADAFYTGTLPWNDEEKYDSGILIEIYEKLLVYYEEEKNSVRAIFLNAHLALEYMEYYLRMDRHDMEIAEKCRKASLKVLSYKEQYSTLPVKTRRSFFISYYNMTGPLPDLVAEYRKDSLSLYKEAIQLASSEAVTAIEEDREMVAEEIRYLDEMMVTGFPFYVLKDPRFKDEYREILRKIVASYDQEDDYEMYIGSCVLEYLDGSTDLDGLSEKLQKVYLEMLQSLTYDGSTEAQMNLGSCLDILFAVGEMLKYSDKDRRMKADILLPLAGPLLNFIRTIPYLDHTSYYHDLFTDLFKLLIPYVDGLEAKEELLMELIIRRQPMTYIHSLMVEKIAGAITEAILWEKGSLAERLLAIGGDREETLRYIIQAARLHDIGKCAVVEVINLQTRKLTDTEFGYIKKHPAKALSVVKKDDAFVRIFDVMLGHHKTYDGKGYPADFDKQNSPYRVAVELISIADSMDAATDLLGRNYTPGKTLDVLLSELVERSGSVYNPDIVSFICSHEALKEKLRELTGSGRTQVYYNAFKRLTLKNR